MFFNKSFQSITQVTRRFMTFSEIITEGLG